ncbi:MAG: hypothetical protein WAZ30_09345 [Syntrophorhabdus sp.]|jgi:predicted ATP-grasp superfamily ATP-dependent carboligase
MNKFIGVIVIEGHVQGLANTRLLGKVGIPVIVVDKADCVARYSKYCRKYFRCPDYQTDEFANFLLRLHKTEGLQDWLLLPSNDHAVYTISKNKARLANCYKVITEDIEVIERIYNKRELLQLALGAGIPIPSTFFPLEENPDSVDLRYPVLIKGNNGLSFYKRWRHKAIAAENDSDLQRLLRNQLAGVRPYEYFVQELIPDKYKTVSVTVFAVKGEVYSHWAGVKLRSHPISFGTATCCQSVYDAEMLELSKKLISELNYTGVCEIEWLRDPRDNEPKLIEINARTWLWVGLAAKCGVNYPLQIWNYLIKGELPSEVKYATGKIWLNLYTDLFYSLKLILKRLVSPQEILTSYRSFHEACWDWRDPLPFFIYGALLLSFLRRR